VLHGEVVVFVLASKFPSRQRLIRSGNISDPGSGYYRQPTAHGRKMSGEIFICYRREESGWVAGRLRDRLRQDFDSEKVFMDIDAKAIPLGANFKQVIEKKVAKCEVLIAVIGKELA
jgi:hypothetical protein